MSELRIAGAIVLSTAALFTGCTSGAEEHSAQAAQQAAAICGGADRVASYDYKADHGDLSVECR